MTAAQRGQLGSGKAPGLRLAIELDNMLHVSRQFGGHRLKARLVGMVQQRILIIQVPCAEINAQFRQSFPYGEAFLVRYIHDGVVIGFRSMVLGTTIEPERLVFLSWPREVEEQSIRNSRRLETLIPCMVEMGGDCYEGSITDLSATGCQCTFLRQTGDAAPDPDAIPDVVLGVRLPNVNSPVSIPGKVRRCHTDRTRMELGIAFEEPQEQMYSTLMAYLPCEE